MTNVVNQHEYFHGVIIPAAKKISRAEWFRNICDEELMKYFCGESEVIVRLREIFPDLKISASNGTGSVCYNKNWFAWNYEMLAPEQQLDTLVGNICHHFRLQIPANSSKSSITSHKG